MHTILLPHLPRAALALAGCLFAGLAAAQATVTTFDDGEEGWNGNALLETADGNPGANMHFMLETFGIELRNEEHPAFIGDMTASASVTVGVDAKADSITFLGSEVSRNVVVEFRSRALGQDGYPWSSVWIVLGTIQADPAWHEYSVTFDPSSAELPQGWGGYGAEDPVTFEPMLPPGVTFADVMANVDELAFTTFEPGWFYGFTIFDARMDNLRITRGAVDDFIFVDGFDPAPTR
jgi:hypothetical protein